MPGDKYLSHVSGRSYGEGRAFADLRALAWGTDPIKVRILFISNVVFRLSIFYLVFTAQAPLLVPVVLSFPTSNESIALL